MLTDTLTPAALLDAPTPQDVAGAFALWLDLNAALAAIERSPEPEPDDLYNRLLDRLLDAERVAMAQPAKALQDLQRQLIVALTDTTLSNDQDRLLRQARAALGLPPAS